MKKLQKRVGLILLVSFMIVAIIPINNMTSWTPVTLTVSTPTFQILNDNFEISVSASDNCNLYLYLDGQLKASGINTDYVEYETAQISKIGKHTVAAIAYEGFDIVGSDTEYTRGRFDITDPISAQENLATDGYRHPNSLSVYDAMMEVLEDSGKYTITQISADPYKWAETIWDRLKEEEYTNWTASNDWYTDIQLSSDYLDDGICNSQGYACNDYATFFSGLARSVGIPSRVWSIVSTSTHGYDTEHMFAEVYIEDSGMDSDWLAMSIFLNVDPDTSGTSRVNWELWNEDEAGKDQFRLAIGGHEDGEDWIAYTITLIWDITYEANPSNYQEKAWVNIDAVVPDGNLTIATSSSYYGIEPESEA